MSSKHSVSKVQVNSHLTILSRNYGFYEYRSVCSLIYSCSMCSLKPHLVSSTIFFFLSSTILGWEVIEVNNSSKLHVPHEACISVTETNNKSLRKIANIKNRLMQKWIYAWASSLDQVSEKEEETLKEQLNNTKELLCKELGRGIPVWDNGSRKNSTRETNMVNSYGAEGAWCGWIVVDEGQGDWRARQSWVRQGFISSKLRCVDGKPLESFNQGSNMIWFTFSSLAAGWRGDYLGAGGEAGKPVRMLLL